MSGARTAKTVTMSELGAHKLFAPPDYLGAVRRDVVLNRIFADGAPRIVVLQGPAGHGKSTLLQQAKSGCEARGAATGWLSFDEADNDLRRFSMHMQALLGSVSEDALDEDAMPAEDAETSARRRRSDWFINRLLQLDRPVALFLDEFQTLKNKSILSFFKELLDRIPERVMVFIGSRSTPEVGLARLIVNHQAMILHADDLRFTLAEVKQFFSGASDLWISSDELDAIYKQTEGWPAALQLFRLSLISPAVRKSLGDLGSYRPRELAEYLADNVLTLQPPRIQDFLLKTSLLTRLCAPLCDAVTGWHNSQEMLLFLERSGLFLRSLDSGRQWFKYHNLFSSFLSEQFREASEESTEVVHRCAAEWHRHNGFHEEAIYHAIEVHDYAFAADVLNTWASRLTADGYLMTVERWSDHIPLEQLRQHPALLVKTAYALVFLRRHKKLKPVMEMLERAPFTGVRRLVNPDVVRAMAAIMNDDIRLAFQIISTVNVRNQDPEGFDAFELGAAANLSGYMAMALGHFDDARECLALARAYSDRMNATFSGGYSIGVIGANLLIQGLLREALERFRASMAEQKTHFDKSFASASMVSCYIWALYQANDFDEAESLFAQYHDMISDSVLLDFLAVAYLSMGRIHDARNRPEKTLELLDEAENIGYINKWPRLIRIVNWERVRRALMRGETDRAQSIAVRLQQDRPVDDSAEWILFSEDAEGDVIGEIRLCIHRGDCEEAVRLLDQALAAPQSQRRVHRRIKLLVLNALAHLRNGASSSARRSLRAALELAEPGRFIRPFIEEGDSVVELLREEMLTNRAHLAEDEVPSSAMLFVEELVEAAGIDVNRSHAQGELQPLDPLTEKEKKILAYLSNGVSNKAMARQIFLSENTIKFHLKNIYSKLAVSSRVQAINAARQMGII
ncbi:MAG: ATP-dependent transcriptional regulator-like protein [Nevskia sp.]|nr:ATP-dependent transcriptional regulator-like protein [Nevskia sp.]